MKKVLFYLILFCFSYLFGDSPFLPNICKENSNSLSLLDYILLNCNNLPECKDMNGDGIVPSPLPFDKECSSSFYDECSNFNCQIFNRWYDPEAGNCCHDPSIFHTNNNSDNINKNFGDFGAIWFDAIFGDEECKMLAYEYLCQKIKNAFLFYCNINQPNGAFKGWLQGVYISLINSSALYFCSQGFLRPDLEYFVRKASESYSLTKNCDFLNGNTCMDDYSIAASAYAWISAWEQKNGRIFGQNTLYCQAINNSYNQFMNSFSTKESICLRDKINCDNTICYEKNFNDILQGIKNETLDITSFEHKQECNGEDQIFENPNYGAGLFTSLSGALFALKIAGADQTQIIKNALVQGKRTN